MTPDCAPTRLQLLLERKSLIGMHHRQMASLVDDLVELGRTLPICEARVRR